MENGIELGRVGVWTWAFDQHPWSRVAPAVQEIEDLGYGTIWFGEAQGREATTQSALLLSATDRIAVAPGVAAIYRHDPLALAHAERTLAEAYPGRFQLGLGVSARVFTEGRGKPWGSPVATMRAFLDAMDAVPPSGLDSEPAAVPGRVLAALGPKMLRLAAERTRGAHPFFLPVEHTAYARSIVGPDALLAVHQTVVLEPDRAKAREIARVGVAAWVARSEMVPSRMKLARELLELTDADLADGGSDRLVDAMVAAGDVDLIAARVREQFEAGADHVCISVATADPAPQLALDELRELAPALL